ncbi:HWE histidine kinase domain-containing protein (plasmid) [Paracoccus marcusii]|uniref:HWE histidine kinase domain-containing protein n=1 Tax=Paracoccus TaxID=265 RepID=UPI001891E7D3|nr:HWE histidine kinase domain-containing protein [Paracoccus marcusii]MBF5080119.1 GAF domain-containing protein [Paracoccus sp. NBH48]QXI66002.1 Blue-light-activated histidine kinase [Paracoccus marcusii]
MKETDRLDALHAHDILDTAPEVGFDDIVRLASRLCDSPVALISLVAADRQWFKAKVGFEPCETSIEQSICKHALGHHDLLVIPDLTLDIRTQSNPLVLNDPHLRFYAGAPLVSPEGLTLGTICVIDHIARPEGLTDAQADDLRALARQVIALLEMRRPITSRDDLLLQVETHRKISEHKHLELADMFVQAPSFMALLKGPDHVFDLVNPAYFRLVGNRQLIGKSFAEALPDAAEQGYVDLLDKAYRSGESFTQRGARYAIQSNLQSPVDERFVDFVCQPTRDENGIVTGIFVEGSDVTEHVRQTRRVAALADLSEQLRDLIDADDIARAAAACVAQAIGGSCIGFGKVDLANETINVPVDWCDASCVSVVGSHQFRLFGSYIEDLKRGETVVISDVEIDPRTASQADGLKRVHARALLNLPIMVRGALDTVIFVLSAKARKWTPDEITLVEQVGDRTHGAIARARTEREQHILNEELSHRMKNTLAIVQAITTQTLREVSERDAVTALTQRIGALSRAHDALLKTRWVSASLEDVAKATLLAFDQSGQFHLDGPALQIGPRATLSLSLLLHELATNAIKYGALSVPEGKVTITWSIEKGIEEDSLRMCWTESGGPPVQQPSGRGFGSRLISMGLIGTGGVELGYNQTGLLASMEAPLSQMQQP